MTYSKVSKSPPPHDIDRTSVVFVHQSSTMAKKKLFSGVRKPAIAALCGVETTILLDQPPENKVYVGEEVDVVDNPSTTASTSVDNEAAADAKEESDLKHTESTISYAETRCSLESELLC
jgi:hypothetical protein